MAARHTERESDQEQENIRKGAEQATRTARTMSDAAETTVRAGAETAQRNSERMLNSWRSSSDAANRIAARSLSKFSEVFYLGGDTARQTMQQYTGNMHAMLETSTIIADGLQDLSGEYMRLLQERAEQNLQHVDEMLACRSFQGWIALQTHVARDQFEAMLEGARTLSERLNQVADQAVRKMGETTIAPN